MRAQCHKKFAVLPHRRDAAKYCSHACYGQARIGSHIGHEHTGATKVCVACGKEFYIINCLKDQRRFCSDECCRRSATRIYPSAAARRSASSKRKRARNSLKNRQYLLEYLLNHPCVDCGEQDPVVLEFDHVTGDKQGCIAKLCRQKTTPTILREMKKCVVRCANCHRRRHSKERGFFRELQKENP